ncbi:hypothetical protein PFISCL1PPCAC_17352, partial [Pristionchus fissidentatus]
QISERGVHSRLDLLKQHLNYSDLLVIFLYVPSRSLWLLTYDWRGGNLLCKLVKFGQSLSFQASSNVIVCIALDRFLSIASPAHQIPTKAQRRTKLMLAFAWILAMVISAPQLYVWSDYLAFPELGWSQCLQMWDIARHDPVFASKHQISLNPADELNYETLYSFMHVTLVFWFPVAIIMLCYLIVLSWVWLNSQPSTCSSRLSLRITSSNKGRNTSLATETIETALGKDWKQSTTEDSMAFSKPRIVVTNSRDECTHPLTDRDTAQGNGQRQSASSIQGPREHYVNSQSYLAKLTRSRAIRTSFLLIAAYIICWLPYNSLSAIRLISPEFGINYVNKLYWLHGLVVLNSVVNPYLYGLFGPIFWRPLRGRADC